MRSHKVPLDQVPQIIKSLGSLGNIRRPASSDPYPMILYRDLKSRYNVLSWPTRKRRLLIPCIPLALLTLYFLAQWVPRPRVLQRVVGEKPKPKEYPEAGVPGVTYPPQDRWKPALDWNPTAPVYRDFPLYVHVTKLRTTWHHAKPFLLSSLDYSYTTESTTGVENVTTERYRPYPDYQSETYKQKYKGSHVSCMGPSGQRLNESSEDSLMGRIGPMEGWFYRLKWSHHNT